MKSVLAPVDYRVKIKENQRRDRYLVFIRQEKKLSIMKVTVIPVVFGALGTDPKGLVREMEEIEIGRRVEAVQIPALLISARILIKIVKT